jgi:DNA-binding MarR family transcriptional regulator
LGIFRETGMSPSEADDQDQPDATITVKLTEQDIKDAARLFHLLAEPGGGGNGPFGFVPVARPPEAGNDREALVARARILFNSRQLRDRYFGKALFGEPAWDILLLLYIAEQSLGRLTATRLAEQIGTPLTTVVRWLNHLELEQFVERQDHPTDRRIMFIKLLAKGRSALDSYLESIPG